MMNFQLVQNRHESAQENVCIERVIEVAGHFLPQAVRMVTLFCLQN